MHLEELANENFSKKMGIGMFAMWLISKCESQEIAYTIGAIAVVGILGQTIVDAVKAWKGKPNEPITE